MWCRAPVVTPARNTVTNANSGPCQCDISVGSCSWLVSLPSRSPADLSWKLPTWYFDCSSAGEVTGAYHAMWSNLKVHLSRGLKRVRTNWYDSRTSGGSREGHRGTVTWPLETHGQRKWSGRSEHDQTKIRAVQIFTAPQNKTNSIKQISYWLLNKRPVLGPYYSQGLLPPRLP